ncbi:phage stabilization protein [Caudoviricetes sp.]|nr:phage stabilization protein [Caudoviricetes sp.]
MSIKIDYTPLSGGLDLNSSALQVRPGRLIFCENFEEIFGNNGYHRIAGYERFDGQPEPHSATYYVLDFTSGTAAIAVGNTVTGTVAGAKVLAVEITSGSWAGGDAAGRLILGSLSLNFVAADAIKVGGVTKATATDAAALGTISEPDHNDYLLLAREALRAVIGKPTGEGGILGVAVYKGTVYAVRNNVGGLSAQLWKSTSSGWSSVRDGLYPGGRYDFEVANFTGSSKTLTLFAANGRGRHWRLQDSTFEFAPAVFGSQATSASGITIGTGAKVFSIAESARSWTLGDAVIVWRTADASKRMVGTVTAYAHPNVTITVTSVVGSGTFSGWEIGLASFEDKPSIVRAHKNHLFLAYPLGQLQHSNTGDPLVYTTSSGLFGLGDDITGLVSMKGDVLGVMCASKIHMLTGSSSSDWQMGLHTDSAGAKQYTTQGNVGNAIFVDDRGITSLQATLNFGNFEPSIISREVASWLSEYLLEITASAIIKDKYQYRLFFSDGRVLTGSILSTGPVIDPKEVSFTTQKYDHNVTCTAVGDVGASFDALFFGTDDGYVMRGDVGSSFDGAAIDAVIRLHFNHYKAPSQKKRFRKLVIEMDSDTPVSVSFKQIFDYDDGIYKSSRNQSASSLGLGGAWGVSSWDTFKWGLPLSSEASAHIDGMGRNMGLLLWHSSATDEPFLLQGLLTHYSPMGLAR